MTEPTPSIPLGYPENTVIFCVVCQECYATFAEPKCVVCLDEIAREAR